MKKIVKRPFMLAIACLVAGTVFAAGPDYTVYTTNTGERYHLESCSSVRNSKTAIPLGNAVSRGYTPCSRCNPPVLD
jgi:hypothetical protein